MERIRRNVKYERAYLNACDNVSAARTDIALYFDWYNTERPHSSLDDQTADKMYWQLLPMMKAAA